MKRSQKVKEYRRRPVGIQVHASSHGLPHARLVYEVDYIEGKEAKTKLDLGNAVFGLPPVNLHLKQTKAEKKHAELTSRPDLFTQIHAAFLLIQDLEMACLIADEQVEQSHGQRIHQKRHREVEDRQKPRPQQRHGKPRHKSRRGRR